MASQQGGLFTRRQALTAGHTRREIEALTRPGGDWAVVRRGIYCERELLEGLDLTGRWLLRDRAACMQSRRASVLSHDSAARVLEIATLEVDQPGSHLTHRGPRGSRTTAGITRHRDLLPLCLERIDDMLVTSYARTAIDIGRWHGYDHGLVAVDSVRNMGVPLDDLETELERMEHHPHIARARSAVRASNAGAESVLETLGRMLVEELHIGEVETQFAVGLAGGRIVWCDLRVGCHIFECHGFVKLVDVSHGGVATEPPERVIWKQQQRQTEICAEGLGASTIVWADCFGQARERAKARLRREYDVTVARFGRELPAHLRRFADEHPRERRSKLWLPRDLRRAA